MTSDVRKDHETYAAESSAGRQSSVGEPTETVVGYEAPVIRELGRLEDLTQGGGGGDFDPGTAQFSKGG